MANDRMFIINKVTGRRFYIAKHMNGPWYTNHEGEMANSWQEYLDQDQGVVSWAGPHSWTIGYEDTEEEFQHLPLIIFRPTAKKFQGESID
jgi:predicted phosphohydrolase